MLGIRERVIHVFRSKTFCRTLAKNFIGELFWAVFQNSLVAKKFLGEGWGECQDDPPKTFCHTVPKIFVGEPFFVSQKF